MGHELGDPDLDLLAPDRSAVGFALGLLTELLFEGDPQLPPDPPGAVTRPEPVPGSDPPLLRARFDIVLGD